MRLAAHLDRLTASHGLAYLKLGTEAEALSFEEIAVLVDEATACDRPVRVMGKIGGPEARNDMAEFRRLGAWGIVAPMVESPYALRNFLEAAGELMTPGSHLGINVETALAVSQFDAMLAAPCVDRLRFVNVGRSDLSASMGLPVDDPAVTDATCAVLRRARQAGLSAHVGGQVTARTLAPVLAHVRPDGFHTRFLGFRLAEGADIDASVRAALEAEVALLELLAGADPLRAPGHLARIGVTRRRLSERDRP